MLAWPALTATPAACWNGCAWGRLIEYLGTINYDLSRRIRVRKERGD